MAALKLRLNVLHGMSPMRLSMLVFTRWRKVANDSSRPTSERIAAFRMGVRAIAEGSKVAEQLRALDEWASKDDSGYTAVSGRDEVARLHATEVARAVSELMASKSNVARATTDVQCQDHHHLAGRPGGHG